ncbi:MAG: hypothetical protein N3F09_07595 [Bacteroidia bacterium]|nr:hypothetical protein [Bacteroidia bacterium]
MLKRCPLIISLMMSMAVFAQDIFYLKNGKIIRGELIRTSENYYILKQNNNLTDSIAKTEVENYFNDKRKELLNKISGYTSTSEPKNEIQEDKKNENDKKLIEKIKNSRNYIGIENDKFFYPWVGLSYERQLDKKGKFGIRVPITLGKYLFGDYSDLAVLRYKKFDNFDTDGPSNFDVLRKGLIAMGGLHFHYYPLRHFSKYFTGIYFNYGSFAYRYNEIIKSVEYVDYSGYPQFITIEKVVVNEILTEGNHISYGILNGFMFPSETRLFFSVALYTGLGHNYTSTTKEIIYFHINGMLKVGLKF